MSIDVITDAEWEIMRVVWTQHHTTSGEIIPIMSEKNDWKPSTVKTLLTRLVDKSYLKTEKEGKQFIYTAAVSEKEAMKREGDHFLGKLCHRKVGGFIGDVIQDYALSQSDITWLEDMLQEKKKTAPESVPCQCMKGQCRCKQEGGC